MQELRGCRALSDARRRTGPAQEQPTAGLAARLEAHGRREADGRLQRLAMLGRDLRAGQPGVEQDRQVLRILLLELLDHRLADPGRGPPVDPPRAVPGAIVPQAVVLLLLRGAVVSAALPGLGRFAVEPVPLPGQSADRR